MRPTLPLLYVSLFGLALNATAAPVVSGQLMFTLAKTGAPIVASQIPHAPYANIAPEIQGSLNDGPRALANLRANDGDDEHTLFQSVLDQVASTVKASIDPSHRYMSAEKFLAAKENAWAKPFVDYVSADDEQDKPFYQQVNEEIRDGNLTAEHTAWIGAMRQALWHLPRFEGVSFRGVRLFPQKIEEYYPLGKPAKDTRFISSSVRHGVATRFASPQTADQMGPDAAADPKSDLYKVAVIFIIKGKSGRPISFFASSDEREQEILFANGTPMIVSAKSPIFQDKGLGKTQIILLTEN